VSRLRESLVTLEEEVVAVLEAEDKIEAVLMCVIP
jgi:hypothetical protein